MFIHRDYYKIKKEKEKEKEKRSLVKGKLTRDRIDQNLIKSKLSVTTAPFCLIKSISRITYSSRKIFLFFTRFPKKSESEKNDIINVYFVYL